MEAETKRTLVQELLRQGILLSSETADADFLSHEALRGRGDVVYFHPDAIPFLENNPEIDWLAFENARACLEKNKDISLYSRVLSSPQKTSSVRVITSYTEDSAKKEVSDFVLYFNARYTALQKVLAQRTDLSKATSISRLISKEDREPAAIIGIVTEKETTKNGNIVLTIEDPTGQTKALINKTKPDLFREAKDIVLDEIIGLSGIKGNNILFVNNLLWPDVPAANTIRKCKDGGYALFIADLHVGSNQFLGEDFRRFIDWINLRAGSAAQKEIAEKVRYIFIVGDLVDGVSVYPSQENELTIKDVIEQYNECARLLSQIPSHIKLVICPGNHDALRLAEPQPAFYREFSEAIFSLPNAVLVSNPSVVNIHSGADFSGYNVLLYHGYSFDYYAANVDSIRNNGGYDRADLIMKFLLRRRHLAPTHTSTVYVPYNYDPLVIDPVPDFFVSGHIHKSAVAHYRGVTLICASCWQGKTSFQEKVGHNPEPSRVPAVNLATREIKILRFGQ